MVGAGGTAGDGHFAGEEWGRRWWWWPAARRATAAAPARSGDGGAGGEEVYRRRLRGVGAAALVGAGGATGDGRRAGKECKRRRWRNTRPLRARIRSCGERGRSGQLFSFGFSDPVRLWEREKPLFCGPHPK